MKRTVLVFATVFATLAFVEASTAQAQRRLVDSPAARPQYPTLTDSTQLQWFMLNGGDVRPGMPAPGAPGGMVSVATLQVPEAALSEMQKFQRSMEAGKLDESVKHLEKAIRIYPQWPAAHHNLGLCYARLKEYGKATTEFQSATTMDAKLVPSWVSLSEVLFLQNQFAEGESAARTALDLDPTNPMARYFLGRAMLAEGRDTPEALEMMEKSKERFPAARLILANRLLKRNDVEAALVELRSYVALPNAPAKEKVECMVQHLTQPAGTANCPL